MAKMVKKLIITIVIFALILGIAGVSAAWTYSSIMFNQINTLVSINSFPWSGSDVLPDTNDGNNHVVLLQNLINGTVQNSDGTTAGIGLNDPNSELNEQLEARENRGKYTFGSMDAWSGSQAEAIFGLNGESENLSFLIYSPSDTVKYIYTTGVDLGEQAIWSANNFTYPVDERIYIIYRTKVNRVEDVDDKGNSIYAWEPEKTVVGSAESAKYDNNVFGSGLVYTPSWNPNTFKPIRAEDCEQGESHLAVGANVNNAILTYVGQSFADKLNSETETRYFKITPKTAGTVTFTYGANTNGLTITVYRNSNLNNVISTVNADGTVTFTATAGTTYYYTVTGNVNASFTIS